MFVSSLRKERETFPWSGDDSGAWRLLSGVALSNVLLFHHSVVVGAFGGGIIGNVIVGGSIGGRSVVGRNDDSFPSSFESGEGLLKKGNGVLFSAATFHVACDVGPEGGFEGIFNVFLGKEEMLFLVIMNE